MMKYIATTGFFDGVHKGHAAVLKQLKETGITMNMPVCAVTFWPHPRIVLDSEPGKLKLLSSLDEKTRRIEDLGIDKVVVIPFTKEFSDISPRQFIVELVEKYGIAGLCVGYDHHIGKDRAGGYDVIKKICSDMGLFCEQAPPFSLGGDSRIISSQKIRKCLTAGNIEEANFMLGYSYTLTGTVVHGKKLGRTIGFPTANIELNSFRLIPRDGVYAVRVSQGGNSNLEGMLYIGRDAVRTHVEVNIFDFDCDIYGQEISVSFECYVRQNIRFDSVDKLKSQITDDKRNICELFRTSTAPRR
jgi:riboflavin kinase/FMN adenylyltransferase